MEEAVSDRADPEGVIDLEALPGYLPWHDHHKAAGVPVRRTTAAHFRGRSMVRPTINVQ